MPKPAESTKSPGDRKPGDGGVNRGEQEKAKRQTGQDAADERNAAGVRNANIHPSQR